MSKSRTSNYVMTIDPNSTSDWERVSAIRAGIRAINYTALKYGSARRYRVTLKGRLGKNNPAYQEKYKKYNGIAYHVNLQDAQRIDVYVHERYNRDFY